VFPDDAGIQSITLDALIAEIQTLDMDTLLPRTHHQVPRAVVSPCEMAIASLVVEYVFVAFDLGLVTQTGVDNAVSDNVLTAIAPQLGPKQGLLDRLANVVKDPTSTAVQKAIAVVRIIFLVEAIGLIATIVEEIWKGFSLLTGAFFAIKFLAKMVLALATDGTSLLIGSLALLLGDASNIVLKATTVHSLCGGTAQPIAAPLPSALAPVSPQKRSPVPGAIAVDGHGTLYEAFWNGVNVGVRTLAPNATTWVTIIQGDAGNPEDPAHVTGLAVDNGGNLYTIRGYTTGLPNAVYKWAPGASTPVMIGGGLSWPCAIALDAQGNVYVADGWPRVVKFDPSAPPGNLGVTAAGGYGRGSLPDQLDNPGGLAVDGHGNIYISDLVNNRVQKWAPGATTGQTVAGGNGGGPGANQLNYPTALAVDSAGNVYVTDYANNRVQIWEPTVNVGVPVAGGQGQGSEPGQLNMPTGIALYGNTLYVADSGNARVMAWDLA
jgi:sugar lactone lactonase YvrE